MTVLRLGVLWLLPVLLFAACGGDASENKPAGPNAENPAIPASVWSEEQLGDAREVAEVRESGKDGEDVIIRGKVKDFVDGRASMTLVDLKMKSCDETGDDTCPEPWDYCCEDPAEMAKSTVTVELVDENGRPLRTSLKGFHDLDHLTVLQVRGKVHRDDAGNVRISASRIARL